MKYIFLIFLSFLLFTFTLFHGNISAYNYIYDSGDCIISCHCGTSTPPGPTAIFFGSMGACSSSCAARFAACSPF